MELHSGMHLMYRSQPPVVNCSAGNVTAIDQNQNFNSSFLGENQLRHGQISRSMDGWTGIPPSKLSILGWADDSSNLTEYPLSIPFLDIEKKKHLYP